MVIQSFPDRRPTVDPVALAPQIWTSLRREYVEKYRVLTTLLTTLAVVLLIALWSLIYGTSMLTPALLFGGIVVLLGAGWNWLEADQTWRTRVAPALEEMIGAGNEPVNLRVQLIPLVRWELFGFMLMLPDSSVQTLRTHQPRWQGGRE